MQSIKGLNERYPNFFDAPSEPDNKGSGEGFASRWGWWSLIDSLTNSRVDKWEKIMDWEVTHGLNICSYYKDKQREEKKQLELVRNG